MRDPVKPDIPSTPILFPIAPKEFWESLRLVIREEIGAVKREKPTTLSCETPGLVYKPLYKMSEVCRIFQVSKPTIYDWVRHGKLKPYKIRSRVYFLWQDIEQMLSNPEKT